MNAKIFNCFTEELVKWVLLFWPLYSLIEENLYVEKLVIPMMQSYETLTTIVHVLLKIKLGYSKYGLVSNYLVNNYKLSLKSEIFAQTIKHNMKSTHVEVHFQISESIRFIFLSYCLLLIAKNWNTLPENEWNVCHPVSVFSTAHGAQ